ncbi:MAG: DUF5822 domain-containing protein [Haloglomus sp.]
MPERVDSTDPDGVDFGWVMQVTFVVTIVVGAPVVAVASTAVSLPTWATKAGFAVRIGALVWFVTAVLVYLYARRQEEVEVVDAAGAADAAQAEAEEEPSSDD